MSKHKEITAGIKITPSFLEKLMSPVGSPENNYAKKQIFHEMQRIEKDIQAALDDIIQKQKSGELEWEGK